MNEKLAKCYVCYKSVKGTTHSILNPKVEAEWWVPPERYICGHGECYSVLRKLACLGRCDRKCCATWHMTEFDLDKHITEIKNALCIHKYTDWATELLKKVGRI